MQISAEEETVQTVIEEAEAPTPTTSAAEPLTATISADEAEPTPAETSIVTADPSPAETSTVTAESSPAEIEALTSDPASESGDSTSFEDKSSEFTSPTTEPENFPTELDALPTEAVTTLTEESGAPTEADTASTEESGAPTEADTASTEESGAPTEAVTTLTEESGAPTEADTTLTEESGAPTEAVNTPTEESEAPTETVTAPTEASASPTTEAEDLSPEVVSDTSEIIDEVSFSAGAVNEIILIPEEPEYRVPLHGTAELKVTAIADDDSQLTYMWTTTDSAWNTITLEETSNTLILTDVVRSGVYSCTVYDGYGNSNSVDITVSANLFKAYPAGYEGGSGDDSTRAYMDLVPGETAILEVTAEAEDLSLVSYQWYEAGAVIPGADSSSYTISNPEKSAYYYCLVQDGYGNTSRIFFFVNVNHFRAYAAGTDHEAAADIAAAADGTATLQVETEGDDLSHVSYIWYGSAGEISGADQSTLEIKDAVGSSSYTCKAEDGFGNQQTVVFRIVTNGFEAYAEGQETKIYVDYNESTTLKVVVEADDKDGITFRWFGDSAGGTGDSCTIDHVTTAGRYYCTVTDQYKNERTIFFFVYVKNNLSAYAFNTDQTETEVSVPANGNTTLSVTAHADEEEGLAYQWYMQYTTDNTEWESLELKDEVNPELVVEGIKKDTTCYCRVTDRFSNTAMVIFHILTEDVPVQSIKLDKEEITLLTGETVRLNAVITPADAANQNVKWTSSNEKVAAVDENGVVTAKTYGTAVITASVESQSGGRSADQTTTPPADQSAAQPADQSAAQSSETIRAECTVNTLYYDVTGSSDRTAADYQYWFAPVYWAADSGITKGYGNVYFGPEENCTREQMITFLYRAAGSPAVSGDAGAMPFADVQKGTYYYNAVLWAYNNQITKGYSSGPYKGLFGTGLPVTREDTVVFLFRMAGSPSCSSTRTFSDVSKGTYYEKAVLWAAQNGIANGYGSGAYKGRFGVGLNVLRKDIVTFLYRYHLQSGG